MVKTVATGNPTPGAGGVTADNKNQDGSPAVEDITRKGALQAVAPDEPPGDGEPGDPVRYMGKANVRRITSAMFESAGAPGQDTIVFDTLNDWSVPVSRFTEQALEIMRRDGGFKVPAKQGE